MSKTRRQGFTLIELLVVISIIALLIGLLLPALGRAQRTARQIKDSTQVRSLHQACLAWSQDNRERYPLPSLADRNNTTELAPSGPGAPSKNRTGNVLSLMLFNRLISLEVCVSPAEASPYIVPLKEKFYDFRNPRMAVTYNPGARAATLAVYDPRFRGTPMEGNDRTFPPLVFEGEADDPTLGNNSYAHIPLRGARFENWSSVNQLSTIPIWCNRGPVYDISRRPAPGGGGEWSLLNDDRGVRSDTLLIHGSRDSWSGNVVYNDGHVQFETAPNPVQLTYQVASSGGTPVFDRDNIFVDDLNEHVEGSSGASANLPFRVNALMRVWRKGIPSETTQSPVVDLSQAHLGNSDAGNGNPDFVWVDGQPRPY